MTLCWELAWPSTGRCLKTPQATIAFSQPELARFRFKCKDGGRVQGVDLEWQEDSKEEGRVGKNAAPQQEEAGQILSHGTQRVPAS